MSSQIFESNLAGSQLLSQLSSCDDQLGSFLQITSSLFCDLNIVICDLNIVMINWAAFCKLPPACFEHCWTWLYIQCRSDKSWKLWLMRVLPRWDSGPPPPCSSEETSQARWPSPPPTRPLPPSKGSSFSFKGVAKRMNWAGEFSF